MVRRGEKGRGNQRVREEERKRRRTGARYRSTGVKKIEKRRIHGAQKKGGKGEKKKEERAWVERGARRGWEQEEKEEGR